AATLGARWPTIAALSLTLGVAATLTAARSRPTPDTVALAVFGALTSTAGVSGAVPTRPTTLGALAVVLVAAAVAGVAGRTLSARTVGWLVGVATAAGLAIASALAANVGLRWAA